MVYTVSRGEAAYRQLKEAIQLDSLALGTRVRREIDIAARFGISRTLTREATRRLESRGLISIVPHPRPGSNS